MRKILAGGLGVVLGLWIGEAGAQELSSHPAERPLSSPASRATTSAGAASPLATLGRPIALPNGGTRTPNTGDGSSHAVRDQQVTPAGFSIPLASLPRALTQAPTSPSPQPLPGGPVLDGAPLSNAPGTQNDSKAAGEMLGPPRLVPTPQPAAPPPIPGITSAYDECGPGCESEECGVCGEECSPCWGLFRRWNAFAPDASRFWFRGEYLLWWTKESPVPPLVTTSPAGTPRELAGVLGAPGTAILYAGDGNPERSGGRFTLGFWFDPDQTIGLESTTLFIGERSMTFQTMSTGVPILARPFFNVATGTEASELVAYPGVLAGGVAVSAADQLWGTELNLRANLWRGCVWHVDGLAGVRFLGLDEHLGIAEGLIVPAGSGALGGSTIIVQDAFSTHNLFVGGQGGLDVGFQRGRWSVDLLGKVALGNTHEQLTINGNTQFAVPGLPPSVQPGGLYALPSNIGHYSRDRFAVVPETGVMIGFQITRWLRAVVGYTFIYNSAVLRPGNQIDRGVNVTQLPSQVGPGTLVGAARPAPVFHGSDFWAQGLSFGLELRY